MRLSTDTHSDILLTHACGMVYKLITILANLHDLHQASNNSKEQDRAKQHNSSAMTTPAVYVPTDPSIHYRPYWSCISPKYQFTQKLPYTILHPCENAIYSLHKTLSQNLCKPVVRSVEECLRVLPFNVLHCKGPID